VLKHTVGYRSVFFTSVHRSALKFITWTSTNLGVKDELCIFPPDISIKLAAYFGFDPVEYKEISAVEAEAHMLQVSVMSSRCCHCLKWV